MEADKTPWEERLKKEMGHDSQRFPLHPDYFETLEAKVNLKKHRKTKARRITWIVWAAVPLAAALAVFFLNREAAVQPSGPVNLEEAAQAFYETQILPEQSALDSLPLQALKNDPQLEEWVIAVEMENIEDNEEADPLQEIAPEEIENYLVENLNVYTEL